MAVDQLATVRDLASNSTQTVCRLIAVASGKGGVGKTNLALNLAIALTQLGRRVLIVDADFSLANVDLLLGVTPTHTLEDVLFGDKSITDAVFYYESGTYVLPGNVGIRDRFSDKKVVGSFLFYHMWPLRRQNDYIIFDTAAGLTEEIVSLLARADEVLVVTTPEPTAIADAYALIKVLHHTKPEICLKFALNLVESEGEAQEVTERFSLVVDHFLHRSLEYVGYVVADQNVARAVKLQRPLVLEFPKSDASKNIRAIAKVITRGHTTSTNGKVRCDI